MSEEKEKGFVKYFNIHRQFGFVVFDKGDKEGIYFSASQVITDGWTPNVGDACGFELDNNPRGGKMAKFVTKDGH